MILFMSGKCNDFLMFVITGHVPFLYVWSQSMEDIYKTALGATI